MVESLAETKIEIETTGEVKRSIRVEIPNQIYADRFDGELNKVASQVRLKGFRQGRAPRALVAKNYEAAIRQEVLSELISGAYQEAITKHSLRVVGAPHFDFKPVEQGENLHFVAEVEVFPEPTVRDYFGVTLTVPVEKEDVTEEFVEKKIEALRDELSPVEGISDRTTAQLGDLAVVRYTFSRPGEGGEERATLDGSDVVEIGKGNFPPAFEAALPGLEIGEKKQIHFALPDTVRDERFAGKETDCELTIEQLHRKLPMELNDEFAKKTRLGETMEQVRAHIREDQLGHLRQANQQARERALFEAILERNPFEVPQVMVDEEIREILFELGALDRRKKE